MERHQPLWQQLEHPNEKYHLHLEATYLAQLQQHQEEEAATDGDRGSDHEMYMSDTGPTLAESDLNIMERAGPTLSDQQDQHANPPDETIQQQQATSPQRPPRRLSKREGVAISTSGLPGAGRGLFGIRPRKGNPLLFKQANEFVCVYATMQDVITVTEAQVTESAYAWTNSKNLHLD